MEPLSDEPNPYRAAAIYHLQLMYVVDEFVTAAPDARLGIIAVAVTLHWPSVRGLTVGNIADQVGCMPAALIRSIARFKTMTGLDSAGGGSGVGKYSQEAAYRVVKSTPSKSRRNLPEIRPSLFNAGITRKSF